MMIFSDADSTQAHIVESRRVMLAKLVRDYHYTQGHTLLQTLTRFREYGVGHVCDIVFYKRDRDVQDIEWKGTRV